MMDLPELWRHLKFVSDYTDLSPNSFLIENKALFDSLPNIEDALIRFEKLFAELNKFVAFAPVKV